MEKNRIINGYNIYKSGTWCEVTKNGHKVFSGSVDENMTLEEIVVFSLNGKELVSYDFLSEFSGERKNTIKALAEENKCNEKDIKVEIRKMEIDKIIGESIENSLEHYTREEFISILEKREKLCYITSRYDDFMIRECDVPDFLMTYGNKYKDIVWYVEKAGEHRNSVLTFKGDTIQTFKISGLDIVDGIMNIKNNERKCNKFKVINIDDTVPILNEYFNNYINKQIAKEKKFAKKKDAR